MATISKFSPIYLPIPYIIGMSLMGLTILLLAVALLYIYLKSRQNSLKFEKEKDQEIIYPKPIEMQTRCYTINETGDDAHLPIRFKKLNEQKIESKLARVTEERGLIPLPKIETLKEVSKPFRKTIDETIAKPINYRRASVPVTLSTLTEDDYEPSLNLRKKSLSTDCLKEYEDEMPESGPNSMIFSRPTKILKYNKDLNAKYKYSIYDDRKLAGDDKYSKYGKIYFSIDYDCDSKTLSVLVKKAQHLNGFQFKGKNRFYIKLKLKKGGLQPSESTNTLSGIPPPAKPCKTVQKKFRTSIQADFCNPNFDESFKFTNVTNVILTEYVLEFTIKEETPKFLSKNRILGYVDFILSDALLIERHESISEIVREILPCDPNILPKANVTVLLEYNETISLLTVNIREFQLTGDTSGVSSNSDINIEVYLRSIDNILQKKKVNMPSAIVDRNICHEMMEFQLDPCFLNSVCLIIVVFAKIRQCPKTPFGRVVIGPIRFTDGPALNHWADMSLGNSNQVIRTHNLF